MKKIQRKTIAVIIFLVAAFFGAATQSDLYGNIHPILTFLIVAVSFLFMSGAISLWRQKNETKVRDIGDPLNIEEKSLKE